MLVNNTEMFWNEKIRIQNPKEQRFKELMEKYENVFTEKLSHELPPHCFVNHEIQTQSFKKE